MKVEKLSLRVSMAGLTISLIFLATNINFVFSIGGYKEIIHFGDALCLVCGLLFSPTFAGICSGSGCFVFDVLNPIFISSSVFTFLFKFIMSYICSLVAHKILKIKNEYIKFFLATSSAGIVYSVLRIFKRFLINLFLLNLPIEANLAFVWPCALFCLINSVLSVVIAVPFAIFIKKNIVKNNLERSLKI